MALTIVPLPRQTITWPDFLEFSPPRSIALDGIVSGGPRYDEQTLRVNFDHHDGVIREATMSTAMQVFMAIKGGLFVAFGGSDPINVYINDIDQDTSLAVWLLQSYKSFEGTSGIPHIHRLLNLTDRLDITGGAYPMNLSDKLVRQHNWIFRPYTELRTSGELARATDAVMSNGLESILSRLDAFMMNQGGETELDTRHKILYQGNQFWIVDEIGGNEARYYLYGKGMNAFVSLVTTRPDGRHVYSIGRRSRFIPFPLRRHYDDLNAAEGLSTDKGWGGSDIIGGSSREFGSKLEWEEIRDILLQAY